MKHIFLYNPAAGQGGARSLLEATIAQHEDCEFYVTRGPRDATAYIERRIAAAPDEKLCFVACGGDGTINEVASGVAGHENACFTVYPCGSGNDFVKIFGGPARFLDMDALLAAESAPIDILRVDDRWCINVFSFGFDTGVLKTMNRVKRKPFMGGKKAYYVGIVDALMKSMKTGCTITVDGEPFFAGDILLCTFANAQYVGGSFRCAPRAEIDDGLIEVCLVTPISRLSFVKLIGSYTAGTHLEDPRMKDIVRYTRAKKLTVESAAGLLPVSLDGEVIERKRFTVEVVPGGVNFALPKA
ncbi:MAG: diacylglycerol kinase family lipid kinase [Clostridia bacterium]|nr:diacylglycerol kinase family lipid kinase [Clostridia bacterium]